MTIESIPTDSSETENQSSGEHNSSNGNLSSSTQTDTTILNSDIKNTPDYHRKEPKSQLPADLDSILSGRQQRGARSLGGEDFKLSLILNLPPTIKETSLLEIFTTRSGAKPNCMANDLSHTLLTQLTQIDADGLFTKRKNKSLCTVSYFPYTHGIGSSSDIDDKKIIYFKRSQEPIAFLSSPINIIQIQQTDVNGIYELEFKVIRDMNYEAVNLKEFGNLKDSNGNNEYPELDGYVGNNSFLEDIIEEYSTVFEVIVDKVTKKEKYQVDYDIVKIILYGCKVEVDFDNLYTSNEMMGTRAVKTIEELPSGTYVSENTEDQEYGLYYFNSTDKTMTEIFEGEYYDKDNLDDDDRKVYKYHPNVTHDDQPFRVDASDKLLFDFTSVLLQDIKDELGSTTTIVHQIDYRNDSLTSGKYVSNELIQDNDGTAVLKSHRDNTIEFTKEFVEYSKGITAPQSEARNLMNSIEESLKTKESFTKIKITFESGTCIDRDERTDEDGLTEPVREKYYDVSDGSKGTYYYPDLNSADKTEPDGKIIQGRCRLSEHPFSVIYSAKLSDANPYLRDVTMISKIFEYVGQLYSEKIFVNNSLDNILESLTKPVTLYEERRTHPALWEYLTKLYNLFLEDKHKTHGNDKERYNNAPNAALEHLPYVGNQRIDFNFKQDQFFKANYYEIDDATRTKKETQIRSITAARVASLGIVVLPTSK